jgi:hypothetical protein
MFMMGLNLFSVLIGLLLGVFVVPRVRGMVGV